MSLNIKNKTMPKLLISLILALVMVCGATFAHADSSDTTDLSFYQRSSQVMQAFGSALAPSDDKDATSGTSYLLVDPSGNSINAGQAGGLLGYADSASDQKGVIGWLTSSFSNSSATFSYDQLSKIPLPNGNGSSPNALTTYAYYGKALNDMGLDKTTADGGSILNKIFGLLLQGIYWLASLAPLVFKVTIKFLKLLNPFMLFDTVINFGSKSNTILGAAATYVGSFYKTIQDMATGLLIPIFFAVMLFSVFVFRSTKASNKIWRYVLRVFIIITAVPLIGGTYTGLLNHLDEGTTNSSKYADYLLYSSFVDFEGWAKDSRLVPPNLSSAKNDESSIAMTGSGNLAGSEIPSRALVLGINSMSHSDIGYIFGSNSNKNNVWNTIGGSGPDSGTSDPNVRSSVNDMLRRYTDGDVFTSSDYEGYVKAAINEKMRRNNSPYDPAISSISKMFTFDSSAFQKNAKLGIFSSNPNFGDTSKDDGNGSLMGIYTSTIYNTGELTRDAKTNAFHVSTVNNGVPIGNRIEPIGAMSSGAGLSPLAMYNYLNTDFKSKSMTVYSSEKASSSFVKKSHYSVVFAGDGFGLVVGMFSLMMVMLSLTVLSLVYAFGMIKIAFYSIPRITAGVFGTTFGSLGSFAKLMISTIILIIEIVGTMLLYGISESIMVSIMSNLDTFTSAMGLGGNANGLSMMATILSNIFSSILAILVTVFSIKNRKKFVKILEEIVNDSIKKLMGGLDNVANNGNAFHDGGAGLQKAMSDGTSQYGRHAAINADQNPNGKQGEKKGGIRQLASEAIGENNRIAHKMARSGEYDAQTPSQAMANSSEIFGRKAGAALKDKALGLVGLEGHNLERDNEYAKQKEHALDEYLRPEMQRDALDDIQGYKQSDDDAYNEELRAAGLDPDSSGTAPFMQGDDADKTGMADIGAGHGFDARVDENGNPIDEKGNPIDQNGNPIDENGKSKPSDVDADKAQDDKGGIKSELLKKPNMKDVERAKNGASAGGYMGAGAAVVGGRVKDAVSKKAVDTMNKKLSSNDDSAFSVMPDKDHNNDKGLKSDNRNGLRSKVKDYASATKEVGPGFTRGFGQAMSNKYKVSGSSDYKQSLHSALVGSDAMKARSNSMSVLKKNGISSYGDYKSKLFDIDKGIESAKKNESKYASDVAKLGATPDGRSSEQYQRASTNLATAQTQRASLLNQRKMLHSHASGLLQQKGLAINGVTSRPFTGNPNAALSMISELRSLQNQSGNFRGKSDSKSRRELGNITSKMSDIRNELSNSGFVVSKLNSLRDIDTFKRQFEDGYTDFFKGKHY